MLEVLKMSDKLKDMIDKLKKNQSKSQDKNQDVEEEIEEDVPPVKPMSKPKEEQKTEEQKDQNMALSARIQQLQNNGIYRLELLIGIDELTTAVKDLTLVIGSLIKD